MFEYAFMRRAFAVGLLLGIIMPCIGVMIVLKRLSMLGDALSHTSLAGVAAGLLLDIDPVLGATAACVAAAFGIEVIRKKIPQYAELSIAVMLSAGVGLAGVLSGFVQNAAGFNSFLFGSIVAITPGGTDRNGGYQCAGADRLCAAVQGIVCYRAGRTRRAPCGSPCRCGQQHLYDFDGRYGFGSGTHGRCADCFLHAGTACGVCHAGCPQL